MQHLAGIAALRRWRRSLSHDTRVALIPTMGALHQGHAKLIREAELEGQARIVSIFVNPIQFEREADLQAYPETFADDAALCESLGVDALFTTSKAEMYPDGFATAVQVSGLDQTLCGATRPGHFKGVTTVVAKLFALTAPDRAYFGEKDFQQLAIIQRMVRDLNMPLEIMPVATARAEDGLALSSRNVNLTQQQRQQAPAIYAALAALKERFHKGETMAKTLKLEAAQAISSAITGARIDYLDIVDRESLLSVEKVDQRSVVAAAVYLGDVRLIDNLPLA